MRLPHTGIDHLGGRVVLPSLIPAQLGLRNAQNSGELRLGSPIAGDTGRAKGVHLHFEVKTKAVFGTPTGKNSCIGYLPKPDGEAFGYYDPAWALKVFTALPQSK